MKIIEAINRIDDLMHNTYTQVDKIRWLSTLDNMVKTHIINTHEGGENVIFTGYEDDVDVHTELLIPAPYDEAYLQWLEAKVHYHNGEYDKYNNAIIMFNTSYDAYAANYHKNHKPVSSGRRFLF
jgi:hypothetical protein